MNNLSTNRFGSGAFLFAASGISIAIIGTVAMLTHEPWVFPSLGPTAFILFAAPFSAQASPRNAISGHLIGIGAGALSLALFGLLSVAPDLEDVSIERISAVTLALALTLSVMVWVGVPHAPAAATAMIVALGVLQTPKDFAVMTLAVIALVIIGAVINRVAGRRTPLWNPVATDPGSAS